MMIPKKVHFIWVSPDYENEAPPEIKPEYEENFQKWRRMNPDFQVKLWGDKEVKELIQTEHPDMEKHYKSLETPVMKADVARFLILDSKGGIYADLDLEILRPMRTLVEKYSTGKPVFKATRAGKLFGNDQVSNYFLMATPGHEIFKRAKKYVKSANPMNPLTLSKDYRVLQQGASPVMYARLINKKENLLESKDCHDCNYCQAVKNKCPEEKKQGYFLHNYDSTWKEKSTVWCDVHENLLLVLLVILFLVTMGFFVYAKKRLL